MSPCLVVCPAGDTDFQVIVRLLNGALARGVPVVLDLIACPGFRLSPRNGTETYQADSTGRFLWMYSVDGSASFHIRGGGGPGGTVTVTTCNTILPGGPDPTPDTYITLGSRTLVAADQNGDLIVGAQDVAQVSNQLGTADSSVDFNCDGNVTSTDVSFAGAHLGHSDDRPVSVGGGPPSSFALYDPRPNPSRGNALMVRFSLASPEAPGLN
jgi:hypothetical protein